MRKPKMIKGTPRLITLEARKLARQLHKEEHFVIDGKIKSNHSLNDWYYLMASTLILKLTNEIKEVSKQNKYLWQTLDEVIVELRELKSKLEKMKT